MDISNLIIEVTRKCNMECPHCLRGDMQNKDMNNKYIDTLLEQVHSIRNVTFSGGEPSLNVECINYFLQKAKDLGIDIDSFYIATNGKIITEEFIFTCIKLYNYCSEKELCLVQISNDPYHDDDYLQNDNLLESLKFFSFKYKDQLGHNMYLIDEGRANENGLGGRIEKEYRIETKDDFYDRNIYLSCDGYIINGCDWSFENQKEHRLCTVKKLTSFYNSLLDED
jgi:organic radical activating enzyme